VTTWVETWSKLFLVTLAVELAVAVPLLGNDQRVSRRVLAVTFAQLASHPLIWFVLPELGMRRFNFVLVAETWAIASEFLLYRVVFERLPRSRAFAVAAIANGASFAVGTFVSV
jgi:hypothetical protein